MAFEYRVGDIIEVSCPFTEAMVNEVTDDEVCVEWPWRDGAVVGLAAGPDAPGWERELFRIRPGAGTLVPGAMCRIGIPPTVLRVTEAGPTIGYLRTGRSSEPGPEPQPASFDPDDGVPRRIELRFRPYAFLESGDEVADAEARVWRFESAWEWQPFGDGAGAEPVWPLMLLTRHGDSDDDAAAVDVVEATQTGSHRAELARWAAEAGLVDPASAEPVE